MRRAKGLVCLVLLAGACEAPEIIDSQSSALTYSPAMHIHGETYNGEAVFRIDNKGSASTPEGMVYMFVPTPTGGGTQQIFGDAQGDWRYISVEYFHSPSSHIHFRDSVNKTPNILPGQPGNGWIGLPGNEWAGVWPMLYASTPGAVLTAASTITPTNSIHELQGTTPVSTITVPVGGHFNGAISFNPLSETPFIAGGNLCKETTAIVGQTLIFTRSSTCWAPSY